MDEASRTEQDMAAALDVDVWAAIIDGSDDDERAAYAAVADEIAGAYVEDTGGGVLAIIVDAAHGLSVYMTADPEREGSWLAGAHDERDCVGTTLVQPHASDARATAAALARVVASFVG